MSNGPCNSYQLDMNAAKFGACKCGWPKADHGKPKSALEWKEKAEHASGLQQAKAPVAPPPPPPPPPPPKPCDFFVADVTASEFGMCTCGFKKAEHGVKQGEPPHARVTLAPQGAGVAEENAKAKDDVSSVFFASSAAAAVAAIDLSGQGGPCGNFTLDMSGGFSICTCGYSKEDHKKVMKEAERAALIEKMIAHGTAAKSPPAMPPRNTVTAKGGKADRPCGNYTLDMNGKTFGDCTCGFSKADHNKKFDKEEDEAADKVEEMVPFEEPLIRDGVNCCSKFELDVANANFDYCVCGFSRKAHQDRKTMSHAEYQKIKALLTKPKEFT